MKRFTALFISALLATTLTGCNEEPPISLSDIRISDMTTEFAINSEFSFDGKCFAIYSDGSEKEVVPTSVSDVNTSAIGDYDATVSYTESNITKEKHYTVTVFDDTPIVVLERIEVSGMTTSFVQDSEFVFDGVCTAFFSSGTSLSVSPTSVSSVDTSLVGEQTVIVTYTHENISKSASYLIEIVEKPTVKALVSISVTDMTTSYKKDSTFSFDGVCTATFNNGDVEEVTPTQISSVDTSIVGDQDVTVSYTYEGITKSTSYKINVYEEVIIKTLESISVSDMTTVYNVGDTFSFDGVCKAKFSNGDIETVTPTSVSSVDTSKAGDYEVTVSYEYEDVTKSAKYTVTVNEVIQEKVLDSISCTGMTIDYEVDDTFSFDGTCTATFSDGTSETVTPTIKDEPDMSKAGDVAIVVSYTYEGVTKEFTYIITITGGEDPEDEGYITLDRRTIELKRISKTQISLIVDFINCESEDVEWSSSDTDVATVRYGLVKSAQKNNGTAIITCTTTSGKTALCVVTVVEEIVPKTERYQLVTNLDSLVAGDIVVMAAPDYGVTASVENTGMKLNPVKSTFSSDKKYITSLGTDTAEFILNGEPENWTLESQYNKYLASTHEGKVTFVNNKGNIHWDIHGNIYDDPTDAVIESEIESHGYFMYNIKQNYFTVYTSNIQEGLLILPKLYKLTYI